MNWNQWVFIGIVWSLFIFIGVVSEGAAFLTADDTQSLNDLFAVTFIDLKDVELDSGPINATISMIGFGAGVIKAVFNLATFNIGVWRGELVWVRYFFFAAVGLATAMTEGKDWMRSLIAAIRG